jgi:hypothetical protein
MGRLQFGAPTGKDSLERFLFAAPVREVWASQNASPRMIDFVGPAASYAYCFTRLNHVIHLPIRETDYPNAFNKALFGLILAV